MFWRKKNQPKKIFTIAFCDKPDLSTQYYAYQSFDSKESCVNYIKFNWKIDRAIENDNVHAYKISRGDWLVIQETTEIAKEKVNEGIKLLPLYELLEIKSKFGG